LLGTGFPSETFRNVPARRTAISVHEFGPGCESWIAAEAARVQTTDGRRSPNRLAFLRAAVAKFAAMLS